MNSRDDNLEMLSNTLTPEIFAKILFKNYSDTTLDYISTYAPTAVTFAETRYQPETVEKLMRLMQSGRIDTFDMMDVMQDSVNHNRSEQYIDDFCAAVSYENRFDTCAVFRATNTADVSFDDIYLGISQGVYEVNTLRTVQMNEDLAREMHDLGISLGYAIIDSENSYVPVQKHRLASALNYYIRQPDWNDFKEHLKKQYSGSMDKLTPYIIDRAYKLHQSTVMQASLADKVGAEYEQYITELKRGDPDKIIKSAYEIYNKDYIVDFLRVNDLHMDKEDLQVLLETDNVLDEIYGEWDAMTQLNGVAEIDTAVEDMAYRLKSAKAVKQVMEQKKVAEIAPAVKTEDKPAQPKPTKRSRR